MEPYAAFEDAIFINDSSRFKANEKFKKNCDYIERSSYLKHLKNLYSIFPEENIKLFLFEEMITDLNKYLNEMCTLINQNNFQFNSSIKYNEGREAKSFLLSKLLAPSKKNILINFLPVKQRVMLKQRLKGANTIKKNKAETKHVINENTRAHLKNIFQPDMEELASFTKLPLKKYWSEFF